MSESKCDSIPAQVPGDLFFQLADAHESLRAIAWAASLAEVLLLCGDRRVNDMPLEELVTFAQSLDVENAAADSDLQSDGEAQA